jgi:hypothetical protein
VPPAARPRRRPPVQSTTPNPPVRASRYSCGVVTPAQGARTERRRWRARGAPRSRKALCCRGSDRWWKRPRDFGGRFLPVHLDLRTFSRNNDP